MAADFIFMGSPPDSGKRRLTNFFHRTALFQAIRVLTVCDRARCSLHVLSIPKGLRPPAQGCEQRATLGKVIERNYNPNGVAARSLVLIAPMWPQPLWGCFPLRVCPRVARKLATLGFEPESLWDSAFLPTQHSMRVRSSVLGRSNSRPTERVPFVVSHSA